MSVVINVPSDVTIRWDHINAAARLGTPLHQTGNIATTLMKFVHIITLKLIPLILFTQIYEFQCATANNCKFLCKNLIGSFMCICPTGYQQVKKLV